MTKGRLAGLRARCRPVVRDPRVVVGVGVVLVAAQLAVRAWAVGGGWFLGEDIARLADAAGDLRPADLWSVRRDHLAPIGVLQTWVLAQSTPYDWGLAAGIIVGAQALVGLAALLFVVRLVGARWVALVPLGWYLFGVATLPAAMWWSAAVLQLPLQLAAFLAMTSHLEYARTRRPMFAALTALALLLGMASDVGVVYLGVPLVFLSLYFSDAQGIRARLVDGLWRQRWAWVGYSVLLAGYVAVYLRLNPLEPRVVADDGRLLQLLIRDSLVPVLLGGPWRWGEAADGPLVPADAPQQLLVASWIALAVLVLLAWRRRRAVVWALVPVEAVVIMHALVLAYGRGEFPAEVLAHEVRYLAVLAPVLTMAVAVMAAALPPRRSADPAPAALSGSATTRGRAVLRVGGRLVVAAAAVGVLVGSAVSTLGYVAGWHDDFPTRTYVQNVMEQSAAEQLRVLDQQVPPDVAAPEFDAPERTRPSWIFRPLGARVLATLEGNDVDVLDIDGRVVPARVVPLVSSPDTPPGECGYRVAEDEVDVPLFPVSDELPEPGLWWGSIAYLASKDGRVGVAVGDELRNISVRRGLHTYVFLGSGAPSGAVRMVSLSDTELCVDVVTLGLLEVSEGGEG